MSLNIKNERVHALAREAARRTGKTQTGVIEEALERLLRELGSESEEERRARAARVTAIARAFDELLTDEDRERMRNHADWLYDEETGLPK